MKHELLIHCFGEWWKHDVEDESYQLMRHRVEVLVSPAVIFHSKIVYDKTTKKILKNTSDTSSTQIEMEVWMMGELPVLNIERRAFERKRKSYERMKKQTDSINKLLDKKEQK